MCGSIKPCNYLANYYCLFVSLYVNSHIKASFSLRSICITTKYQITQLSKSSVDSLITKIIVNYSPRLVQTFQNTTALFYFL